MLSLSLSLLSFQCVTGRRGAALLLPQSAPSSLSASISPTTATLSPRITCKPPRGCSSVPASAENTRSTQSERIRLTAWSKPRSVPAMTLPSLQMTVMAAVFVWGNEKDFEEVVEVEFFRRSTTTSTRTLYRFFLFFFSLSPFSLRLHLKQTNRHTHS